MGLGIAVNLDLFSVGITVASIGILGFVIFFNNPKSITSRSFLLFSLVTVFWGIANYLSYQAKEPDTIILFLRLVIASAVWHAFTFFQLAYVFPEEKIKFPRLYKFLLVPAVVLSSIINLTPLSFSKIKELSPAADQVSIVEKGPGMLFFIILVIFLVLGGIFLLIKKIRKANGIQKKQLKFVFFGFVLTFSLLFAFNFFLPAVFDIVRLIPLGAIFILPFVAFTAYAIFRHHLLNVKVIATEGAAFLLTIVSLFEVILSNDINVLLFRSAIFVLTLIFSIFLIRSVLHEVEQREELQRLTEELKTKNVQLDELSHFKTQLLSLASHQVKSPLAAMKGFVSLIMDGTYGEMNDKDGKTNDKIKEALGKVRKSADDLVALINTLLDLRKVEEGKMDYQFAAVDLVGIVSGVFEGLKPLAAQKKLEFTCIVPPEKIMISADATKLQQVIQNLADNAIKYTPSSNDAGQAGYVKVAVEKKEGTVVVSVRDSGLGISSDLLPHLFEEFVRDEKVKQKILGTGLGLYIARKIVEAHHGKMWAESGGEGKGSQFYVELTVV